MDWNYGGILREEYRGALHVHVNVNVRSVSVNVNVRSVSVSVSVRSARVCLCEWD